MEIDPTIVKHGASVISVDADCDVDGSLYHVADSEEKTNGAPFLKFKYTPLVCLILSVVTRMQKDLYLHVMLRKGACCLGKFKAAFMICIRDVSQRS